MEFESIPTVPTADEVLDRSLRRAAKKMKDKRNRDRANEEFVRSIAQAVHDRLDDIVHRFPSIDSVPPFYRDMVDILFGVGSVKKSLGAVSWAARSAMQVGIGEARLMRHAEDTLTVRRRAVARIASIVHQVDGDLRYLNDVRNALRELPDIRDEFTIVVAGYPNVGKSSFIRRVTTAEPEVASYPFTTRGILLGHRTVGRERVQFVDTPGILDRPMQERNPIERQALSALMNVAHAVLFILDASETCGYTLEEQRRLLEEVEGMVAVPLIVAVNKADIRPLPGFLNMSTETGSGVGEVLDAILTQREPSPTPPR
ncbi:MAG: 50S ribosome-binding GTPase [Methanomicrobiales archaeon]|nr:50S ribosome-binding GTPase [Methanomicrobiales archaeon]MDI6875334.1 50S ribosome-binding GTPase [Methanomicrobiales archaeon]